MNTKHLQEVEQRRGDESGDVAGDGDLRILCQKKKKNGKRDGKLLTYAGGAHKGRRVLASPQSSWLDDRVFRVANFPSLK